MDLLNDDCLVSIFRHIHELRDQVRIAQTCQRFNTIFRRLWLHQQRYKMFNLQEWHRWLPDINDLSYFFNITKGDLISIVVGDATFDQFLYDIQHLFKTTKLKPSATNSLYCLKNVQNFFDEEKPTDSMITDNEMELLVQMVPNLLTLHVKEPLSGRHVCNFHKLEELYIYVPSEKPFEINNDHFEEICRRLKNLRILDVRNYDGKSQLDLKPVLECNNLAVLRVNLHPLKCCLQEVLRLPKLECLNVMLDFDIDISSIQNVDTHDYKIYETVEFYEILNTQSARIIGLSVDLYYFPFQANWPLHLKPWESGRKYKQISLCNCEYSADSLIDYTIAMNSLEILCCRYWPNLSNYHVLHFVKHFPKLQHLDISYCPNIGGDLLDQMLDIVKQQDRKQPLHVYYLLSGLELEVKKLMLQLLDLNDDCLYGICTFLELNDLLSIKNVCRRLAMIVKLLWRHKSQILTIKYTQMEAFKGNKMDFIDLMTSSCEILETLIIHNIESSQLKWISHIQFPKLKSLLCYFSHHDSKNNDDDIVLLTKLCPSITLLKLESSTTGQYIKNMNLLNNLDLSGCLYLKTEYLNEIFKTLKLRKFALLYYGHKIVFDGGLSAITDCSTLEELKIDDQHLLLFIDKLSSMRHLRKIIFYARDNHVFLMDKLTRLYGSRMHTLILNFVLWSNDHHIANICLMANLKRFILEDDDIQDDQLEILAKNLKQLREFHAKSSHLESDNGILEIVRHCKHLEMLNVTETNISKDFLKSITKVLSEMKRDVPLFLYCSGTAIAHDTFIQNINLHVSTDDPLLDLIYARSIHFEWHNFAV